MKFFLDCEFSNRPYLPVQLLSIGVVSEDNENYYAQVSTVDYNDLGEFQLQQVIPKFSSCPSGKTKRDHMYTGRCEETRCPWRRTDQIATDLLTFCGLTPEFWGASCGFDYDILSQLFGTFQDWPHGWPFFMYDVDALAAIYMVKFPDDPCSHHAMNDAYFVQACHDQLVAQHVGI